MKALEKGSILDEADLNGDGIVTDDELMKHERMIKMENDDKKEDQIRKMAWFALWGMLLYPMGIFITSLTGLDQAAELIADIAPTYFVAIAGLTATFFGAHAYSKGK